MPTIFQAADDRVGISDATVSLCYHARKYLGRVLDTGEEDFDVYWRWLNDRGGIHGRRGQERSAEDSGGGRAAQAYEECRGSFLLRGIPGAEAITPMRKIVEADPHGPPYLHFLARAEAGGRRSFSFYPSHETFGRLTGQFVLSRFAGARIGVIYKASNGWDAGRLGFLAAFREAGASLVAEDDGPQRRVGVAVPSAVERCAWSCPRRLGQVTSRRGRRRTSRGRAVGDCRRR